MTGKTSPRGTAAGFSIIELAVVVMIVGIALTMSLKGQVVLDIAKGLWAGYELQIYQNRVQLYGVQYGYIPGDDPKAEARYGREKATHFENGLEVSDVGNNRLEGRFMDYDSPNGEQFSVWRDLRYARLVTGNARLTGRAAMPANPFGGVFGFDQGNLGQEKGSICLDKVPGRAAEWIDEHNDDGLINQGEIVARTYDPSGPRDAHFATPDSQPYDVEKTYILCASLAP